MAYILGIVLFALGIGLTVGLHEAGHFAAARAFGMRVRRFSIGFGPKVAGFTRGHTEFTLAPIPVGGFCDIAGMTPNDEYLTDEEAPHAMYLKPWWQRIIVMSGGVAVNIVLGFAILVGVAMATGLPDLHADMRAKVGETVCSADQRSDGELQPCEGSGPAAAAGIAPGDIITRVDGQDVVDFMALRDLVAQRPGKLVEVEYERDGQPLSTTVQLDEVMRANKDGQLRPAGSIGLSSAKLDIIVKHDFPGAIAASAEYSAYVAKSTVVAIVHMPTKVPGVVASIFGAERTDDSPMSVVGASRVGGELVERNLWSSFFMMLASLNYFLALFNLIPLPPFDGGHIAIIFYEQLRNALRRLRGLAPKGAVDYQVLLPVTYVIASLLMVFGGLVMVADVVNPIRVFG